MSQLEQQKFDIQQDWRLLFTDKATIGKNKVFHYVNRKPLSNETNQEIYFDGCLAWTSVIKTNLSAAHRSSFSLMGKHINLTENAVDGVLESLDAVNIACAIFQSKKSNQYACLFVIQDSNNEDIAILSMHKLQGQKNRFLTFANASFLNVESLINWVIPASENSINQVINVLVNDLHGVNSDVIDGVGLNGVSHQFNDKGINSTCTGLSVSFLVLGVELVVKFDFDKGNHNANGKKLKYNNKIIFINNIFNLPNESILISEGLAFNNIKFDNIFKYGKQSYSEIA